MRLITLEMNFPFHSARRERKKGENSDAKFTFENVRGIIWVNSERLLRVWMGVLKRILQKKSLKFKFQNIFF